MKAIGYIVSTFALLAYNAVLCGWTLSILWAWFFVPTFGFPVLSIPAAVGLAVIVNYVTAKPSTKKDSRDFITIMLAGAGWATLKAVISLAFGAVVKVWL